jgi:hypothetical protein
VEWEEQAIAGVDRLYRGHDGVRRLADLVYTFHEQRVIRTQHFLNESEALEAAGLRE